MDSPWLERRASALRTARRESPVLFSACLGHHSERGFLAVESRLQLRVVERSISEGIVQPGGFVQFGQPSAGIGCAPDLLARASGPRGFQRLSGTEFGRGGTARQHQHEASKRPTECDSFFFRCNHSAERRLCPVPPFAASFMILTIVSSTSCATPFSFGVLNNASRMVGFHAARIVLPPRSEEHTSELQ